MNKEIIKPERVMYYEGSKMSFLEYVDKLEAYAEKLEEAINYTHCCSTLPKCEHKHIIGGDGCFECADCGA
jgi:hypothetical protein